RPGGRHDPGLPVAGVLGRGGVGAAAGGAPVQAVGAAGHAPAARVDLMIDQAVFVLLGINILMGWSFYVILLSGQFSFGNAGFMALGAYGAGVATVKLGLPLAVGLLIAVVGGALIGWLVGLPALRGRGGYLALATIAFAFLVENLFINLDYTGA